MTINILCILIPLIPPLATLIIVRRLAHNAPYGREVPGVGFVKDDDE